MSRNRDKNCYLQWQAYHVSNIIVSLTLCVFKCKVENDLNVTRRNSRIFTRFIRFYDFGVT